MAYNAVQEVQAFVNEHWIPKKVGDQIGEFSALMKLLLSSGRTDAGTGISKPMTRDELISGGDKIKRSVRFARQANATSISGYDTFNVENTRKYEYALYDWRTYLVPLSWSLDDELANRGKEAVLNKMDADMDGLISDMAHLIATGLYNSSASRTGAQGKGLNGLRELCSTGRTWGTIDSSTYTWWDAGHYDTTAHTLANLADPAHASYILTLIRTGIDNCTHAGEAPTHIVTSTAVFNLIEDVIRHQKLGGMETRRAVLGYEYISYRGTEIIADQRYCPDYHAFYLNLNGSGNRRKLGLKGREGAWFQLRPPIEPVNQLAKVWVLYTQCCLYGDAPRVFGANTSLGAS